MLFAIYHALRALAFAGATVLAAVVAVGVVRGDGAADMVAAITSAEAARSAGAPRAPAGFARLPRTDARPAPFGERARTDLRQRRLAAYHYSPRPNRGTLHTLGAPHAGTTWWGWAPDGPGPHPAVILLHGGGERTGESMVDLWRPVAERAGLVLIAPNMARIPGWNRAEADPAVLAAIYADAARRHAIDPGRVGLFGHSRGGMTAQWLANRVDGPWGAVVVHAGTRAADTMQPVADGVPIRHMIGSHDRTFPYDEARAAARGIAAKGHPFDLVRMEGRTHWLYDRGEAIAAMAWQWLDATLAADAAPRTGAAPARSIPNDGRVARVPAPTASAPPPMRPAR